MKLGRERKSRSLKGEVKRWKLRARQTWQSWWWEDQAGVRGQSTHGGGIARELSLRDQLDARQLYVKHTDKKVAWPNEELKGFQRVRLQP